VEKVVSENGKTRAIVAHITIIGWIVALVLNTNEKDEYASFYIRQTLGLFLTGIVVAAVGSIIPFIGVVLPLAVFALWIVSLIWSVQEVRKPLPYIGQLFQDWFHTL
jgi:uncharacterized membrane protein